MKRLLAGLAIALGLTGATPAPSPATAATPDSCKALEGFAWPSLVVQEIQLRPAGPAESQEAPPGTMLPAHCLLRGVIAPRQGPEGVPLGIGFEIRLPIAWSGRFVFQGGGGLDGILHPAYGSLPGAKATPALARGFAVASSDGGHRSATMLDARFATDQQARSDYAYNAVDKVTLVAKALIQRFYGRPQQYSYFAGCSNGGRQGMIAAQRLPLEFDGIVSGDPTFRLAWTNVAQTWNQVVLARAAPRGADGRPIISRALSDADLTLVAEAVQAECDGKDGLKDGMINDFRACRFDPRRLTYKGVKTDRCLTAVQITALRDLMSGPRDSKGRPLYAAFPYDTGIADRAFRQMHFGTSPTGEPNSADAELGFDSLRYYAMTPPDPSFDPMTFDFDRDTARIHETSKLNDADAAYVGTFARRGKLLMYHGLSDQGLSPLDTAAWYDRLHASTGGETAAWARLFMVPGMTHCSGGKATDEFDMLSAIQAWVEDGKAPERIVATGRSFPGVTRPLCPYPTVARYQGGDPNSEKSFACKA